MYMILNYDDLKKIKTYVTYNDGFRIVYYYEKYHEVLQGAHAREINDFYNNIPINERVSTMDEIDNILNYYLNQNDLALGVSIYNINQECIKKKIRRDVNNLDDREVYKEELIYDYNYISLNEGYRIVYFKENGDYYIGAYAKKIEDFMYDLYDIEPIEDETPPSYISNEDILMKELSYAKDYISASIYDINGNLITNYTRIKNKL